jgi:adenylate cyclase
LHRQLPDHLVKRLTLNGTVVGILALTQELDRNELTNISRYEQPLSQLIAELDVYTDRYELEILRVLRSADLSLEEHEVSAVAIKELADQLRKSIASSEALLVKATKDRSFDTEDRIELARIGGVLRYLSRDLEEFLAIGETTLAAVASGKQQEARQASLGFAKFAQAFGPDLSQLRHDLDNLTSRSTSAVLGRQRLNAYLTFALFLPPADSGLVSVQSDRRGW